MKRHNKGLHLTAGIEIMLRCFMFGTLIGFRTYLLGVFVRMYLLREREKKTLILIHVVSTYN